MPWTWLPLGPHGQTGTKSSNQHVLELLPATLRHPSTIPLLLAHSPVRSCRSSAGQITVEHPACMHCITTTPTDRHHPEPPDRHSVHHSVPRTPRHAPVPPMPARRRPCTSPRRPRHGRATPLPATEPSSPAYLSATPGLYQHHTTSTTPSPSPRSSRSREEEPELTLSCMAAGAVLPLWWLSAAAAAAAA